MVLKPVNDYQIIIQNYHNFKCILINDFQHHQFLYQVKVLSASFFCGVENNQLQRRDK